jgi:hypothetical protein
MPEAAYINLFNQIDRNYACEYNDAAWPNSNLAPASIAEAAFIS